MCTCKLHLWHSNYVTSGLWAYLGAFLGIQLPLVVMYKISWPIYKLGSTFAFFLLSWVFSSCCWQLVRASQILWRSIKLDLAGQGHGVRLCKISVELGRLGAIGVCHSFINTLGLEILKALALLRSLFMIWMCL